MDFVTIKSDKWFFCLGQVLSAKNNVKFDQVSKRSSQFSCILIAFFIHPIVIKINFD